MSEDEWFERGGIILDNWRYEVNPNSPNLALTSNEESAFEYAWEMAGREMGIIE